MSQIPMHFCETILGSSIEQEAQLVNSALTKVPDKHLEEIHVISNTYRARSLEHTLSICETLLRARDPKGLLEDFKQEAAQHLAKFSQITCLHQMKSVLNAKIISKIAAMNAANSEAEKLDILSELETLTDSLGKIELALQEITRISILDDLIETQSFHHNITTDRDLQASDLFQKYSNINIGALQSNNAQKSSQRIHEIDNASGLAADEEDDDADDDDVEIEVDRNNNNNNPQSSDYLMNRTESPKTLQFNKNIFLTEKQKQHHEFDSARIKNTKVEEEDRSSNEEFKERHSNQDQIRMQEVIQQQQYSTLPLASQFSVPRKVPSYNNNPNNMPSSSLNELVTPLPIRNHSEGREPDSGLTPIMQTSDMRERVGFKTPSDQPSLTALGALSTVAEVNQLVGRQSRFPVLGQHMQGSEVVEGIEETSDEIVSAGDLVSPVVAGAAAALHNQNNRVINSNLNQNPTTFQETFKQIASFNRVDERRADTLNTLQLNDNRNVQLESLGKGNRQEEEGNNLINMFDACLHQLTTTQAELSRKPLPPLPSAPAPVSRITAPKESILEEVVDKQQYQGRTSVFDIQKSDENHEEQEELLHDLDISHVMKSHDVSTSFFSARGGAGVLESGGLAGQAGLTGIGDRVDDDDMMMQRTSNFQVLENNDERSTFGRMAQFESELEAGQREFLEKLAALKAQLFGESHFAETIKPVVRADDEEEAGAKNDADNEVFEVIEERRVEEEIPARSALAFKKEKQFEEDKEMIMNRCHEYKFNEEEGGNQNEQQDEDENEVECKFYSIKPDPYSTNPFKQQELQEEEVVLSQQQQQAKASKVPAILPKMQMPKQTESKLQQLLKQQQEQQRQEDWRLNTFNEKGIIVSQEEVISSNNNYEDEYSKMVEEFLGKAKIASQNNLNSHHDRNSNNMQGIMDSFGPAFANNNKRSEGVIPSQEMLPASAEFTFKEFNKEQLSFKDTFAMAKSSESSSVSGSGFTSPTKAVPMNVQQNFQKKPVFDNFMAISADESPARTLKPVQMPQPVPIQDQSSRGGVPLQKKTNQQQQQQQPQMQKDLQHERTIKLSKKVQEIDSAVHESLPPVASKRLLGTTISGETGLGLQLKKQETFGGNEEDENHIDDDEIQQQDKEGEDNCDDDQFSKVQEDFVKCRVFGMGDFKVMNERTILNEQENLKRYFEDQENNNNFEKERESIEDLVVDRSNAEEIDDLDFMRDEESKAMFESINHKKPKPIRLKYLDFIENNKSNNNNNNNNPAIATLNPAAYQGEEIRQTGYSNQNVFTSGQTNSNNYMTFLGGKIAAGKEDESEYQDIGFMEPRKELKSSSQMEETAHFNFLNRVNEEQSEGMSRREEEPVQILEEPIESLMEDYPMMFKNPQLKNVIENQRNINTSSSNTPVSASASKHSNSNNSKGLAVRQMKVEGKHVGVSSRGPLPPQPQPGGIIMSSSKRSQVGMHTSASKSVASIGQTGSASVPAVSTTTQGSGLVSASNKKPVSHSNLSNNNSNNNSFSGNPAGSGAGSVASSSSSSSSAVPKKQQQSIGGVDKMSGDDSSQVQKPIKAPVPAPNRLKDRGNSNVASGNGVAASTSSNENNKIQRPSGTQQLSSNGSSSAISKPSPSKVSPSTNNLQHKKFA